MQPQSPVQTPVTQQPQLHVAQQQGSQFAGQAPAQQALRLTAAAEANSERTAKARFNIQVLLEVQSEGNRAGKTATQTGAREWARGRARLVPPDAKENAGRHGREILVPGSRPGESWLDLSRQGKVEENSRRLQFVPLAEVSSRFGGSGGDGLGAGTVRPKGGVALNSRAANGGGARQVRITALGRVVRGATAAIPTQAAREKLERGQRDRQGPQQGERLGRRVMSQPIHIRHSSLGPLPVKGNQQPLAAANGLDSTGEQRLRTNPIRAFCRVSS